MAFGTASNTYVAPGITSTASKAAQSGPLEIVTSDASGHLATNTAAGLGLASLTDINAINSQLAAINSQIGGINTRLNDLDGRTTNALNGVSMAHAVAAAHRALCGVDGLGHVSGHQRRRAQRGITPRHQRPGEWRPSTAQMAAERGGAPGCAWAGDPT